MNPTSHSRHAARREVSRRRANKSRRLSFDCLEDRRLLSLSTPGTPVTVDNSGTASGASVAMDAAGDAVVAWNERIPTTGNWNHMFQQYTKSYDAATGLSDLMAPVGSAVTVAGNVTAGNLGGGEAVVVARAPTTGDFVIVWGTGANASRGAGTYTTNAQLYSAAGTPIGGAIHLSGNNLPKSVAMNDTGFDVLYGSLPKNSAAYTLTVQRYSYSSTSDAAVGKPISVITPATSNAGNEKVAMDANGDFVVAWKDYDSATNARVVDAELFTNAGKGQGLIQVGSASNALNQDVNLGDVAMDAAGDFVVAWGQTPGMLYARQFPTGGTPVEPESNPIPVAQAVLDSNGHFISDPTAAVGLAETGDGAFDISWQSLSYPEISNIDVRTYDGTGNLQESFAVTNNTTPYSSGPQNPSVAVDGGKDLLVVWTDISPNASTGSVDGQFYLDPPAPPTTASSPTASTPVAAAAANGSTTAATDAVFAGYAYPEDEDTLG